MPQSTLNSNALASRNSILTDARLFAEIMSLPTHIAVPEFQAVGVATNVGGLKSDNEDSVSCGQKGGYTWVVVADGCGGLPRAREASETAVRTADATLAMIDTCCSVPTLLSETFQAASRELERVGALGELPGLMTTLIVAVVDHRAGELHYRYIGDGGIVLIKHDGRLIELLHPMRGVQANHLTAALGAKPLGSSVAGVTAIEKGDLIFVMSDGVSDVVDQEAFFAPIHRFSLTSPEAFNAQAIVDYWTTGLAELKDDLGFICHDNLSFGLLRLDQSIQNQEQRDD